MKKVGYILKTYICEDIKVIKLLGYFCSVVLIFIAAYWAWETQPFIQTMAKEYLHTGDFLTLEEHFTADQIMESHRAELLKDETHVYLKPSLNFYPYVLMEVKYVRQNNGTGEGVMLWSLEDGEMILDTGTWEQTHGYEDCITAKATRNDFKIINTIAQHGNSMDRESLLKSLYVESDILDSWLDSVKRKQLIIQKGNDYRLHFQNPKLQMTPVTRIRHRLVKKPYKHAVRISGNYSASQIHAVTTAAYGSGFAIRSVKKVFLPAYVIEVKNPDGSTLTTQWNAVTGKRIKDHYIP